MSLASNFRGTLFFRVHELACLQTKCDPYVKLSVSGGRDSKTSRRNNCRDSAHFDEETSVSLNGSEDWLQVEVWDWDRLSSDDLVATSGRVPIAQVIQLWTGSDRGDVWINLRKDGSEDPVKLRATVRFERS